MKNILFICTGNSARSIIAESIINHKYSQFYKSDSAGSNTAGQINVWIKKFLEEKKKYNLNNYFSKNFEIFLDKKINFYQVITVCNNANNEVCPIWPEKKKILHWDIDDPVSQIKNEKDEEKAFLVINRTFNTIEDKINLWIKNEK